jgi:hypothetical protein
MVVSSLYQRFAQRDAVAVDGGQQPHVEAARNRAAAQESAAKTHAFFFGKRDHLQVVRQAPAVRVQVGDHGDRQQDTQTAVIFAAIAYGVVVRACRQRFCARLLGGVAADDIAHRVDVDRHAGLAHPAGDARGGALVGRRHVGAGQVCIIVADGAQRFAPVHHARA